jgi:hypothetical protein
MVQVPATTPVGAVVVMSISFVQVVEYST